MSFKWFVGVKGAKIYPTHLFFGWLSAYDSLKFCSFVSIQSLPTNIKKVESSSHRHSNRSFMSFVAVVGVSSDSMLLDLFVSV